MDIYTLDLNFQDIPQTIASYLVVGPDGPILVETGPASTSETLRLRLAEYGLRPTDIKHVLVTHIHLDHAGAAGWLAQQGAQIYVHHVGAPHLIDPSRLLRSAARIYGDAMDTLWGQTRPAPPERVTAVRDGHVIGVAGLRFEALDTPGHAWHHHCYRLGDVAFTGDAAGVRIGDGGLVDLPAPPPEFKPEAWQKSIDRLLAAELSAIYPTHFGRVDDVEGQLQQLRRLLVEAVTLVDEGLQANMSRDELLDTYLAWVHGLARAAGLNEQQIKQYETANPHYMSVDGIMRYWRKKQ